MKRQHIGYSVAAVLAAVFASPVHAIDLTAGDWKFSVNGNVNVDYIYSKCERDVQPIVTVGGACTASSSGSNVSNVGNGLLPAAITFGISTTQAGWDLAAHFGLYPGIDTNDGGSPNLQATGADTNTALGTTGLDVRQVYMTFGNSSVGTFTLGRNFGLFGFDAIINDMTLPGVGVAGSMSSANPANTSLGSIGFGYLYVDTLAQMDWTSPDFSGFNVTLGIYDPVNSLTEPGTPNPKSAPGAHAKASFTMPLSSGSSDKVYFSVAGIFQKQNFDVAGASGDFTSRGIDFFAKIDVGPFSAFGYYYTGNGLGTTALFVLADDGLGHARKSDGYLVQATYTMGPVKLGVNYGSSRLNFGSAADGINTPNLLDNNNKVTGGIYYSLTPNLTLLGEVSHVRTLAHNDAQNTSNNFNVGSFLKF
ncbi:MAG TPA: porin [Steroidobacteraceae bacterium]|nr:porin [Steroidobacteraceae bacterium]